MPNMKKSLLATSIAVAILTSTSLSAQIVDWNGSVSDDWFEAGNWAGGNIPIQADSAHLDVSDPGDGFETVIRDGNAAALDSVTVGNTGSGELLIANGTLSNNNGVIGAQAGSIGEVQINAVLDTSVWGNASSLTIGSAGTGTLTVVNGGEVNNVGGTIASVAGSKGTVTIDGQGSSWLNFGTLTVGREGEGLLSIVNGGFVSASASVIGAAAGSTGTVEVTGFEGGEGSTWNTTNNLTVGNQGVGILNIHDNATVNSGSAIIAAAQGSTGTVTVAASSTWNNTGELVVGAAGNGALAIDGGLVSAGSAVIGAAAGSSGGVSLTGGSLLSLSELGVLTVGESGNGTLTIDEDSLVTSGASVIGNGAGSQGSVIVTNAGKWLNTIRLIVGESGTGTLDITNGGQVSTFSMDIAEIAGAVGTVTVDGAGADLSVDGAIFFGADGGTGLLTIKNGGTVSSSSSFIAGDEKSVSMGTVEGVGSLWNTGDLSVGFFGSGALTISGAGQVVSSVVEIGSVPTASGTVTVEGVDSLWTTGDIFVGNDGTGTLTVGNGGQVVSSLAEIGRFAGAVGTVTVQNGSTWHNDAESITVGAAGTGALNVSSGSQVTSLQGRIGEESGSIGTATVTGQDSLWSMPGSIGLFFNVGFSGTGTLTISDGGRVEVGSGEPDGVVSTIGDKPGSTGTVTVDGVAADGTASSWITTGDLAIGSAGTGALTIANGGLVQAGGAAFIAQLDSSIGVLNIGAAAGEAAVTAGTLASPTLIFGAGTGTLNFNHTDADYRFDAALGGNGQINILAGHTTLTADSTAFGGGTNVQGGTLSVDGKLGGGIVIQPGARLDGVGAVGSLSLHGTVAPGHSIGTLTVGDYRQLADATYEAEIDAAGQSDRIVVNGAAQLAGTLAVHGQGHAAPATYTLLTAGAGVSGQFATIDNLTSPFVAFSLRYDPNAVFLDITRSALTFSSLGITRNQIATGAALDRLALTSPLVDTLVGLDQPTATAALDKLSGELHASTRGALLEEGRFVREAASQRLRDAQGQTDRAAWAQAYGNNASIDRDGNAATTDIGSGGVLLGGDMAFGQARLGVLGGIGRTSVQVDDRGSKANSDSLHLGVYGGANWGAWGLRTGVAYSRHDVETERHVAFGNLNEQLRANYDSRAVQGFVEAAYRIETANASYEPYLNLAQVSVRNDAYQETGGTAALRGEKEDTDSGFATLGLRAGTGFKLGQTAATLHGSLGWRRGFGDELPLSHHAFAGGDTFVIAGSPIERDAAVIGASVDLQLSEQANLDLGYNGQLGEDSRQNSVQAQLRVKF